MDKPRQNPDKPQNNYGGDYECNLRGETVVYEPSQIKYIGEYVYGDETR